jgi:hypothetical protein
MQFLGQRLWITGESAAKPVNIVRRAYPEKRSTSEQSRSRFSGNTDLLAKGYRQGFSHFSVAPRRGREFLEGSA